MKMRCGKKVRSHETPIRDEAHHTMKTLILDTSPLIALYLGEPTAAWINDQLNAAERLLMSTVNLGECLIILRQRKPAEADMLTQQLLTSSIEFVQRVIFR